MSVDMQPHPAIPPFEPPPLSVMITESGRRILWIVGLYRAVCGVLLLGTALFLDLPAVGIGAPNAFVTTAGLYFVYGILTFWWVQRDSQGLPLPVLLLTLLAGDIAFIAVLMYAEGSLPLPILLFPQLAASGWLLRSQMAFFHAALASSVLLVLDGWRLMEGQISATQI